MTDEEKAIAVNKLVSVCCCVKKQNTPEFMSYFADTLNAALEALGTDDRVRYPGKWSNELHLESGS